MAWFTANWFWVLIFIGFIAMHLFHGGHGGHGEGDRQLDKDERERDGRIVSEISGGHQH